MRQRGPVIVAVTTSLVALVLLAVVPQQVAAGWSPSSTAATASHAFAYVYDAQVATTTPTANVHADARATRPNSRTSSGEVRLVSGFVLAAKAGRGGAGPVRLGQAGEDAVRGAYDIGPKIKIDVAGRKRIPDGLTSTTLSEVKNVSSLSYSQQLRDFAQYAQQSGRSFDLYVRPTTSLSGPLQRAAGPGGPINLRFIP